MAQTSLAPTFQWPTRRKVSLRRRKVPTARLGGKRPRRGQFFTGMFRRMRLKRLRLYYCCMVKKLKDYYRNLVKDMTQAAGTIEAYQQRLLMECSFLVPVMGLPISICPSIVGSEHPWYSIT
ncbi:hypothetical protein K2173_009361 [Erythroxylum novogranatense]|uniref:Uncharacterized protein n=1 Tax=Erythroxylum novogranatense TaxID=1862640 RepID=A0AAV8U6G9_9ROSI|nr:hypothetical protein K2173_009361 [Erythroxylum novogranatense]